MPVSNLTLPIFVVFFIFHFSEVYAAKLYKWVDEQGVTHFGYAPPPAKEKSASKIQTINTKDNQRDSKSSRRYLSGHWYTKKNHRITRKLELSYGDFKITDLLPGSYSLVRKKVASGKSEVKNGMLILTYFEHLGDPSKLDTTEVFEISFSSDTRLELVDPKAKRWVFKKQDKNRNSEFFRDLNGEWLDKRGIRYRFKQGTFTIYPTDRPSSQSFGNLEWADPELTLDYVVDYTKPVNHAKGRSERWVLRDKDTQLITFVVVGTGQVKTLQRKR